MFNTQRANVYEALPKKIEIPFCNFYYADPTIIKTSYCMQTNIFMTNKCLVLFGRRIQSLPSFIHKMIYT